MKCGRILLPVKSAAAQAVNENFAAWYSAVQSDRQLLGISMAGMKDFAGLSGVDKAQFIAMHMALLLNAQNAFYQWQDGWLSSELWRAWDLLVERLLLDPGWTTILGRAELHFWRKFPGTH